MSSHPAPSPGLPEVPQEETILDISRNPNPRLALAVARYLGLSLGFEFCAPFDPKQSDFFRRLNPSLRLRIGLDNQVACSPFR